MITEQKGRLGRISLNLFKEGKLWLEGARIRLLITHVLERIPIIL
jgi:hypothetical protein